MGSTNKKERFVNLDALRIVAMMMVVTLHFLDNEGFLRMYPPGSLQYTAIWAIEIICIVAVNCYVLLSGYFLSSSQFKIKRLVPLILQTLFYSLGIYLVLLYCGIIPFNLGEAVNALLPIPTGMYWFISAYIGLYLLSPFLNRLLDGLDQRLHLLFIVTLVGIFSVWPSIFTAATPLTYKGLDIVGGYSITWFIVLYVVAGYLRRYSLPKITATRAFLRYAVITGVSIGVYALLAYATRSPGAHPFLETQVSHYISYNSLPVLLSSVALFLFFISLKIPRFLTKPVAILAPLTLGVYLLTEEPHMRTLLWGNLQPHLHLTSPYVTLIGVGAVMAIYFAASSVELVRQILFESIAKLHIAKKMTAAMKAFHKRTWRPAARLLFPAQNTEV